MTFKLAMMVDLCMVYMLMLIPVTLTFMQGHSGSEEEKVSVKSSRHLSRQ